MMANQYDCFAGLDDDYLLKPFEVARALRVNPKTVTRWARTGKLHPIKTLGGHRRFRVGELRQALRSYSEQL